MDPKLLFWSLALVNLGLVLWCMRRGVGLVRAGEIAGHRRHMLSAGALIVLFLVSYVGKVVWLGKEDRSVWTALDHGVLYVHETCVVVMLLAGAVALFRAWRFRAALGPNLVLPSAPLVGGASHGRAGRIAAWAALFSFVTAGGVLAGMFLRASEAPAALGGSRNLVLVSLDTLRADRLGLYGYERDTSPRLDAWSREAFVFERAHSAANATAGAHHALFQSRPASVAFADREAPTLAALLAARGYRTAGFTDGGTMARAMGFAHGFDHYDDGNKGLAGSLPKALEFLDAVAGGSDPFYLFVHSFDVHLPYDPPPPHDRQFFPEYEGRVKGSSTLPLLRGVRRIFEGANRAEPVVLDADERKQVSALYDGEIAKTDRLLARLLARIEAADLRDDTLVVVLSDHGEEFWEHGSVLHSHTLYQELVHVPLILRVPGWRAEARRIPMRVSMLDVLPTLLELLGVSIPGTVRGRSLVPLLRGEPVAPAAILAEGRPYGRNQQSVIAGRFKLIRSLPTGRVSLYDLDADPQEQRDIAQRHPGVRKGLVALLDRALPQGARPEDDPLGRPEELDPELQQRLRELGYVD